MPDELPPLSPELVEELAALGKTLEGREDQADTAAKFEWLLDLLILRGQLPASFRRLAKKVTAQRSPVHLAMFRDKYTMESPDIDCAARIHLCHAKCCSFEVTLSAQDVEERSVPFDISRPYMMPRTDDRRCVCMDDQGMCTIYDKRPGVCRQYDCRNDQRVWLDFEKRIPAP